MQLAFLGVIPHWQMKHVRTDWQFHIFVQWSHTPIVKNPPWIPHPLKKIFMFWSLQKHIPPSPWSHWPKDLFQSRQTLPYLQLYPLTSRNQYFFKEDTSFPLGSANESASSGEIGSFNPQSSSPKHKAQHSIIKWLDFNRVTKLTPWKWKVCDRIRNRDSVLCKLRKKYMKKNLK